MAPTLHEWVDQWLPAHTAGPATLAKYESMLHVHILPRFGNHRLDEISRNEIKAFVVDLRSCVAPVTARSIVTVLGLVLREAIEEHYLYFDPTNRLRLRDGVVVPRPVATPGYRHSFVSLLSDDGVSMEDIADLCGHAGTTVTEQVYRHQLRPVLLGAAVAMDRILGTGRAA